MTMAIRHFLQFSDFTADEYAWLFERAAVIKKKFKAYEKRRPPAPASASRPACTSWAAAWST
jgi:ornithine carbamoyltransferase